MAGNELATQLVKFLNANPSPYHVVASVAAHLSAAGFKRLNEDDAWHLAAGGQYYFTRNASTIVAFAVGGKFSPGNGFGILGTHTDSPVIKVKPCSNVTKAGYVEVGVETYGGGTWPTWFDRDLGLAGRAVIATGSDSFAHKLVHVPRGVLRVSNLAIHLNREMGTKLELNPQRHLLPILATQVKAQAEAPAPDARHHPMLMKLVADAVGCAPDAVRDFDLNLFDATPAALGGATDEFVYGRGQDNQWSCFAAMHALTNAAGSLASDDTVRVVAMFDNEEVGSTSAQGANSSLMKQLVQRITSGMAGANANVPAETYDRAFRRSYMVSVDMAHAVHPNYLEHYEDNHHAKMHHGIVFKHNANQRYATTAPTAWLLREIAQRNDLPVQDFVVRNDSPCGSTIGPMMSANTSIRTIDVGAPLLSMHSIRECSGAQDLRHGVSLFTKFFEQWSALDAKLRVDAQ